MKIKQPHIKISSLQTVWWDIYVIFKNICIFPELLNVTYELKFWHQVPSPAKYKAGNYIGFSSLSLQTCSFNLPCSLLDGKSFLKVERLQFFGYQSCQSLQLCYWFDAWTGWQWQLYSSPWWGLFCQAGLVSIHQLISGSASRWRP